MALYDNSVLLTGQRVVRKVSPQAEATRSTVPKEAIRRTFWFRKVVRFILTAMNR